MGLRDTNPYIDSDLTLIITTFEKTMIESEDENALLVPFRREIDSFSGFPRTAIDSISALPSFNSKENSENVSIPTPAGALNDDDEALLEQQTPGEDADNDEEWINKAKNWIQDCLPCDFRSITKFDPNFHKDIKADWENALGNIEGSLNNFENNLLNSGNILSSICEIASQLKFQCVPDLQKIIWLLTFVLSKLNRELSVDLNIFDNLLTGILTPVFNAMLGNLDLIDDLALGPIRCIIDNLNASIQQVQNANLRATVKPPSLLSRQINREQEERTAAETARQEAVDSSRAQQSTQSVSSYLAQAKSFSDFDVLRGFLETGFNYVKNYKKWLKDMLQEMVNSSTESWNRQVGRAGQKQDLLRLIGLIKSVIEASENGDFVCGTDETGLTQEEFRTLIDSYIHPNTNLEVSLEDDNLVIRRDRKSEDLTAGDVELQSTETTRGAGTAGGTGVSGKENDGRKIPSNIVLTKPVSSCLKNIKVEEYNQVQLWISQLEEESE